VPAVPSCHTAADDALPWIKSGSLVLSGEWVEAVLALLGETFRFHSRSQYCKHTMNLTSSLADDELEIRTLVSFHGKANVQYILDITPLNEVLNPALLMIISAASHVSVPLCACICCMLQTCNLHVREEVE